jgi:hypothetical protein
MSQPLLSGALQLLRTRLRALCKGILNHKKKVSASVSLIMALVGYANLGKVTPLVNKLQVALQSAMIAQTQADMRCALR